MTIDEIMSKLANEAYPNNTYMSGLTEEQIKYLMRQKRCAFRRGFIACIELLMQYDIDVEELIEKEE